MKLKGQTAIVTGAASGIGARTALLLSREGANIVLVDSSSCIQTLQAIQKSRGKAVYLECLGDVRDEEFVNAVIARSSDEFGELHVLVNNVCICSGIDQNEQTLDKWELEADMNAQTTLSFIRAVSPFMIEQKYGRIVNISSVSGCGSGHMYTASKNAISNVTRETARKLGEYGVTCNSVAPVLTRSLDDVTVNQTGTAVSIAEAVLHFASSESSYTTGQILKMDGGYCIGPSHSSGI